MSFLFQPAIQPATDVSGDRVSGAKWRFELAGTTTLTSVYSDAALSIPLTNPVVANSAGVFPLIYLDPDVSYRARLYDANDIQLGTSVDDYNITVSSNVALYSTLAGTGGAALIGTSTGETVEARLGRTAFGIGLFTSFVGTPPEIDTAIKTVYTDGYGASGVGIARYIYDAAVDASYVTTWPRSSFFADDGRGFRIDPRQDLHIEMFGGRADTAVSSFTYDYSNTRTITAGTDNLAPLTEALQLAKSYIVSPYRMGQPIHCYAGEGQNAYYFSDTIVPENATYLKGTSGGWAQSGGTIFLFPADTGGLAIHLDTASLSTYSSHTSVIEGICFLGSGGTDRDAHGVKLRGTATFRDCAFEAFSGDLINNEASASVASSADNFGLTSGSHFERVYLRYAGNWAMYTEGADTSASCFISIDCQHARLGGIYDNSAFGNAYIRPGIHSFGNGIKGQVHHGGRHYVLVDPTAGIGASTTPGTNNRIWYDVEAGGVTASYPAWSALDTYEMSSPIGGNPVAFSNTCVVVDPYIEGNVPISLSPGSIVIGGTGGATRYTRKLAAGSGTDALNCPTGMGGYKGYSPSHADLGSWFESTVGVGDGIIAQHGQESDGFLWKWEFSGADIYYGYGGQGSGNPVISKIAGPNTTETFGTSTAQPHWKGYYGLAIGSRSAMADAVRVVAGSAAPVTGTWRIGDRVFNNNATAGGNAGWICVTAGTPGVWKTFGTIAA